MKLLILDNYDSFTYNLVQYIQEILDQKVEVHRNDEITLEEVDQYDTIVLSPGPGLPEEAGIMPQLIKKYHSSKRILGVCLGHQAIGEAFGAKLQNLNNVFHGVATKMKITDSENLLFQGMESNFEAGRYHSWVIQKETLSADFVVTATDDNDEIMAMRHKEYPIYSVQFHPESVMTPEGKTILTNFLQN